MNKKDFQNIFKDIDERRQSKVNTVLAVLVILITVTVLMGVGSSFNIQNLVSGQAYSDANAEVTLNDESPNDEPYTTSDTQTETEAKTGFFSSLWAKLTYNSGDNESVNETEEDDKSEVKVGLWAKIKAFFSFN